jgi:hypothetical protein
MVVFLKYRCMMVAQANVWYFGEVLPKRFGILNIRECRLEMPETRRRCRKLGRIDRYRKGSGEVGGY